MPRLQIHVAMYLFSHTPSRCSAYLNTRTTLTYIRGEYFPAAIDRNQELWAEFLQQECYLEAVTQI